MSANDRPNHYSLNTPFGPCAFVYKKKPFRIGRLFLPGQAAALPAGLRGSTLCAGSGESAKAREVARRLEGYFNGELLKVPMQWLELGPLTALQRKVLMATAEIPYGHTVSYGDLAEKIDRPRAYRFVGSTMGLNPVPLIIPCHRVIKSNGSIGRFGGGAVLKRELLNLEKGNLCQGRES